MSTSDLALRVEGLSKSYTIAHDDRRESTLAETLLNKLKRPGSRVSKETFWALKDVSFDVKKGDVVGIIGRNGAGKSTLLKILSRITEPTTGRIELFGRIGSLLEVGTGFHPELTGRENIYLNGAILGMRREEIRRQFDAIVDFSGVEKFLDTPVKRYSSGMYVRLAFAVAAHLNPEILIVDEVLAVGDAEFQKKCLGKMKDVASGGRTVLFVSHNMAAVENLCTVGILLDAGHTRNVGGVDQILTEYQTSILNRAVRQSLSSRRDRTGTGDVQLTAVRFESPVGVVVDRVRSGQDVNVILSYKAASRAMGSTVDIGLSFGRGDHDLLSVIYASYTGVTFKVETHHGEFRCRLPELPLAPSVYRVGARAIADGVESDWPRDGISDLVVEEGDFYGTGATGHGAAAPLLMKGQWSQTPTTEDGVACT